MPAPWRIGGTAEADPATWREHIAGSRIWGASACADDAVGRSLVEDDEAAPQQGHVIDEEGAYEIQVRESS